MQPVPMILVEESTVRILFPPFDRRICGVCSPNVLGVEVRSERGNTFQIVLAQFEPGDRRERYEVEVGDAGPEVDAFTRTVFLEFQEPFPDWFDAIERCADLCHNICIDIWSERAFIAHERVPISSGRSALRPLALAPAIVWFQAAEAFDHVAR